ncbi:hypothetical protein [Streptomyces sp. NPDC057696]|uniref:hypothetical protein n=1 Tax=unclassified Streptomyces TaxID=2593676 RepID=UPI0036A90464
MAYNHRGPLLLAAEESGDVAAWWFIRKAGSWRLRVLPADSRDAAAVLGRLTGTLKERAAIRHAEGVIHESETRRLRRTGSHAGRPRRVSTLTAAALPTSPTRATITTASSAFGRPPGWCSPPDRTFASRATSGPGSPSTVMTAGASRPPVPSPRCRCSSSPGSRSVTTNPPPTSTSGSPP